MSLNIVRVYSIMECLYCMKGKLCEWYAITRRVDIESLYADGDFVDLTIDNEPHNVGVFRRNLEALGIKIHREVPSGNKLFMSFWVSGVYPDLIIRRHKLLTAMKKRFDASDFSKTSDFLEYLRMFDNSADSV